MSIKNYWYVVGKKDNSKFGCSQVTPKGEYFKNFQKADEERIYLQPDYDEKLVVLKRTCEIVTMRKFCDCDIQPCELHEYEIVHSDIEKIC